ncbi:hypothetical protein E2C01_096701 [Portunus trituberculatus]|uniref:Uncharacterized protein n=1 Tax=Portunus trituberculatus TaxID=210409 RepID=A0A5B7JYK7_PORTR|nr:hypothetical protein [Portunus trituberculatus]
MLQGSVQLPLHPHRGWIPPPSKSRELRDNPGAPQGWLQLSLPQRVSHLRQTVIMMLQVNGYWSAVRRNTALPQIQHGLPASSQTSDGSHTDADGADVSPDTRSG